MFMQTTGNIMLVEPACFGFNPETAGSNAFQVKTNHAPEWVQAKAVAEFEQAADILKSRGLNLFIFKDTPDPVKPDAVFPNNWVSFHADGTVILYPMEAPARRPERRMDFIDGLKIKFQVKQIIDLSIHEKENRFLEGTGSIVFDHIHQLAYASLSPRTNRELFLQLCDTLQYQPVLFHSFDNYGKEIYHTNVMMCMGEQFAVVCLAAITDHAEREKIIGSITGTGRRLIDISFEQMKNFAGNMLELRTSNADKILALSQSAFDSLSSHQRNEFEAFCECLPLSIKTIETIGGGSARCMLAEIFLPER